MNGIKGNKINSDKIRKASSASTELLDRANGSTRQKRENLKY